MNTQLKPLSNTIPFPFSQVDTNQMAKEGWAIFNILEHEVQIQRDNECANSDTFMTDDEAWVHVIVNAALGGDLHKRSIAYIKQYNYEEFVQFVQDAKVATAASIGIKGKQAFYLLFSDGTSIGFDSEVDATNAQHQYRTSVSLDPDTGK